jgi:5'-3' exonuclease
VKVHLVDGTFELFRAFFSPAAAGAPVPEMAAVRGLVRSMLYLLRESDVTHVALAFDHVIESFRNDLFPGYKTSEGVPAELLAQFHPAEDAARALGLVVWPMVELEADDALATAAARLAERPEVEQVVICSPDKDLTQCVRGTRVVTRDRMRQRTFDEDGVKAKFGVPPASIPDWLALVGDSSDGYPGLPRWGEKSAAAVLARYGRLEAIPEWERDWDVSVRGAAALGQSLREHRDEARLYRTLATLRTDAPIEATIEALRYPGVVPSVFEALTTRLGGEDLAGLAPVVRTF